MSRKKKEEKLLRLNLGTQDVENFDKVKFNPLTFPWPVKDGSVEELVSPMMMNYIPAKWRQKYVEEMYRVLVPGGKALIWVPYYTSMRASQDYMEEWPPYCEASFMYFNKEWMKVNHPERNIQCDFDLSFSYQAEPETSTKADEMRSFMVKHYVNAVRDLQVTLTKK